MPRSTDTKSDSDDGESKPFMEHLEDLRRTLVLSAVSLFVGMCIAGPFATKIMEWITRPLSVITDHPEKFLQSMEVVGAVSLWMRVMLWGGLIIASPFILYFIGGFIFPGLTPKEKKVIRKTSGFAAGLFAVGIYLGFQVLPIALRVMKQFHEWMHLNMMWTSASYFSFVMQLLLAFGLVFEMPVVLVILGNLGIISAQQLREKRRHVIVLIFIIAALLTPPDVCSQVLMAVPMLGLFEITILVIRASERRREKAGAEKPEEKPGED